MKKLIIFLIVELILLFWAGWPYALGIFFWLLIVAFVAAPVCLAAGRPSPNLPEPQEDVTEALRDEDEHPLILLNEYRRNRGK